MESHIKRDGKTIEELGQYNPQTDPKILEIKEEKVKEWLAKGAKPTDTVARLLGEKGLIEKPIRTAKKKPKKAEETTQEAKK
ncbi:MAG: small subunit ribosomal protein S16 [Candidatus Magnetoglobus multicellularis str. Araruama]|uniref:30S ribosomal protein S16 n=1 Tax=Candidatus Magnetoglobus multicellularis str. Araruama TaxID=890399 RepID=A0A1V1P321_9BACT|nr:MAG: small subunit ribosomal protein S16 [Candidatus Magnetoglobus multicellularis str. Araruama]